MFGKTIQRLILGLTILFSLAVLSVANSPALAAEIEPLHGFYLTDGTATIMVTSNGCTQKEDFISILEKSEPPVVTFIRLKPDFCKAASTPYRISFSVEEIGAKVFKISNLVEPAPR
ncbi:MAG: hypothetical protein AAGA60_16835 [Cyanobacteria bacterium P01_E01_bin.42]